MKKKGRLGGAAWFYAQGQRAAYIYEKHDYVPVCGRIVGLPLWAKHALEAGFNGVHLARERAQILANTVTAKEHIRHVRNKSKRRGTQAP